MNAASSGACLAFSCLGFCPAMILSFLAKSLFYECLSVYIRGEMTIIISIKHADVPVDLSQFVAEAKAQVLQELDLNCGMRDAQLLKIFHVHQVALNIGVRHDICGPRRAIDD